MLVVFFGRNGLWVRDAGVQGRYNIPWGSGGRVDGWRAGVYLAWICEMESLTSLLLVHYWSGLIWGERTGNWSGTFCC